MGDQETRLASYSNISLWSEGELGEVSCWRRHTRTRRLTHTRGLFDWVDRWWLESEHEEKKGQNKKANNTPPRGIARQQKTKARRNVAPRSWLQKGKERAGASRLSKDPKHGQREDHEGAAAPRRAAPAPNRAPRPQRQAAESRAGKGKTGGGALTTGRVPTALPLPLRRSVFPFPRGHDRRRTTLLHADSPTPRPSRACMRACGAHPHPRRAHMGKHNYRGRPHYRRAHSKVTFPWFARCVVVAAWAASKKLLLLSACLQQRARAKRARHGPLGAETGMLRAQIVRSKIAKKNL